MSTIDVDTLAVHVGYMANPTLGTPDEDKMVEAILNILGLMKRENVAKVVAGAFMKAPAAPVVVGPAVAPVVVGPVAAPGGAGPVAAPGGAGVVGPVAAPGGAGVVGPVAAPGGAGVVGPVAAPGGAPAPGGAGVADAAGPAGVEDLLLALGGPIPADLPAVGSTSPPPPPPRHPAVAAGTGDSADPIDDGAAVGSTTPPPPPPPPRHPAVAAGTGNSTDSADDGVSDLLHAFDVGSDNTANTDPAADSTTPADFDDAEYSPHSTQDIEYMSESEMVKSLTASNIRYHLMYADDDTKVRLTSALCKKIGK